MRISSDLRSLFAIGKLDDYELLRKENNEMSYVVRNLQARLRERIKVHKSLTPTDVCIFFTSFFDFFFFYLYLIVFKLRIVFNAIQNELSLSFCPAVISLLLQASDQTKNMEYCYIWAGACPVLTKFKSDCLVGDE